ncbi:TPA: restriction endonuclease subunit S [Photobacterium damselae]
MSWPLVPIKSVANVTTGKTPSKKVDAYFGGDIPFITPAELGEGQIVKLAKQTLTKIGAEKIKLVPKNSVLVCCIGSLGKLAIADRELGTNQQINSVTFNEQKVFPKYGYYALKRLKPILESIAPSTTVAIVNKSNFEALEIPLPPLKEQQRIAAILDKADAIRQKRKQAIELADEFLRSVFLDMFGDPVTNPKGWEIKPLSELIIKGDKINYGIVQPGEHIDDGIPIVRVGDICDGSINQNNLKRVCKNIDEKHKKSRLHGDEILITCVGATIGKVALADTSLKGFNTVRALTRVRLNEVVNRHFVFRYLQSPFIQGYFHAQLRTVGQPTLNGKQIGETPILLPSLDVQNDFLKLVEKFQDKKNKAIRQKIDLDELFNSLSQKAFSGQL